jgi:hypothetical protein
MLFGQWLMIRQERSPGVLAGALDTNFDTNLGFSYGVHPSLH